MVAKNHKNSETYLNQLRKLIADATIESVPESIGTTEYLFTKYKGNYIRILNKTDKMVIFINKDTFIKKLKFYNLTFEQFIDEIELIDYTIWF